MSTNGAQWPEKVVFEPGISQRVALKYGTGKRITSRIPGREDDVLYSLTDNRSMFVPLKVDARISSLGLAVGEAFDICKKPRGLWTVAKAPGSMRADPMRADPERVDQTPDARRQGPGKSGTDARDLAPAPSAIGSIPHRTPDARRQTPDASRAPAPGPWPLAPVNGQGETAAMILAGAYPDAIKIALGVVEMGRVQGLHISPSFEDVRCIAFSISGLGGRR